MVEGSSAIFSNIVSLDKDKVALITANKATLSTDIVNYITALCDNCKKMHSVDETVEVDLSKKMWIKCGSITLTHQDRNQLSGYLELTDKHINAAQELMKLQFPEIDGLRNTHLQNKPFQQQANCSQILQAIFIRRCHWACVQINKGSVCLYDSAYSSASSDTLCVISQLVQCMEPSYGINVMNIAKQIGVLDCGLYAIAILTSLAFDQDPTTIAFTLD